MLATNRRQTVTIASRLTALDAGVCAFSSAITFAYMSQAESRCLKVHVRPRGLSALVIPLPKAKVLAISNTMNSSKTRSRYAVGKCATALAAPKGMTFRLRLTPEGADKDAPASQLSGRHC